MHLQTCWLTIWYEATTSHKMAFGAHDRTLQDLRDDKNVMGGVTVVLFGEFDHPLLQDHVIEAPLLARPLGSLVVAASSIPVRFVLLAIGDELALLALSEYVLFAQ